MRRLPATKERDDATGRSAGKPSDDHRGDRHRHRRGDPLDRLRRQQAAVATSTGSPLLSVKETCAYLRISRSELHRLEQADLLTPIRFGRRVFYGRDDLDEYIRRGGGP